jgi:hypothetical protein
MNHRSSIRSYLVTEEPGFPRHLRTATVRFLSSCLLTCTDLIFLVADEDQMGSDFVSVIHLVNVSATQ